ncbi:hypothetical protein K523DRAFT_31868 [Schizophyllum commune Tattone D]|nr:hypothetical protein K523DRAFT_31868 [Schizophyllum commune Tattone D]
MTRPQYSATRMRAILSLSGIWVSDSSARATMVLTRASGDEVVLVPVKTIGRVILARSPSCRRLQSVAPSSLGRSLHRPRASYFTHTTHADRRHLSLQSVNAPAPTCRALPVTEPSCPPSRLSSEGHRIGSPYRHNRSPTLPATIPFARLTSPGRGMFERVGHACSGWWECGWQVLQCSRAPRDLGLPASRSTPCIVSPYATYNSRDRAKARERVGSGPSSSPSAIVGVVAPRGCCYPFDSQVLHDVCGGRGHRDAGS